MANDCNFDLLAKGRKEDLEKLKEWLESDYHYFINDKGEPCYEGGEHHFWRIFDFDGEIYEEDHEKYVLSGYGTCAWSVYCCMIRDNAMGTYYLRSGDPLDPLRQKHEIDLLEASRLLNLSVEIFASEPGCGFAEHYLISDGKFDINDQTDYLEFYFEDYDSKEEAEKAMGRSISDEQWGCDDCQVLCDWPIPWEFAL